MNTVNMMTNYHLKTGVKSAVEMSCLTNTPKKKKEKLSIVLEGLQLTKHFS